MYECTYVYGEREIRSKNHWFRELGAEHPPE